MTAAAQSKLQERGIFTAALSTGWTFYSYKNQPGWRYPVYDVFSGTRLAWRWKALDSRATPKYVWLTDKNAACKFYTNSHLRQAIQAAGGVLYIANGEPSVLAYIAAGVPNVLSWFGETSVPATLAADLQRLGVREVRYPADKDETGRKSALKVRELLTGSGILFKPLAFDDDVPDKGDANDLWRACGFAAAEFQRRLAGLAALILPEPSSHLFMSGERDISRLYSVGVTETRGEINPDLINAIAARLGVTGFRANGWSSRNVLSPFREEKRPSAAFNRNSGVLHDFGTGESYSVREVAEQLQIDWWAYQPPRPPVSRRPPSSTPRKISGANVARSGPAQPHPPVPSPLRSERESKVPPCEAGSVWGGVTEIPTTPEKIAPARARSWWDVPYMPQTWRAAALHLADSAAMVVEKLHEAFYSGKLDAYKFTVNDVAAAANISVDKARRTLAALDDIFWQKIRIREGKKLTYTENLPENPVNLSQDNPDNSDNPNNNGLKPIVQACATTSTLEKRGRQADHYRIITGEMLKWEVVTKLKCVLLQRYHTSTLALPQKWMGDEIVETTDHAPLTDAVMKAWEERIEEYSGEMDRFAQYRYRREIYGNNRGWYGWSLALNNMAKLDIGSDWQGIKEYRAAIVYALWKKAPDERHHRADLARMAGCSEDYLDNLYAVLKLKPVEQWEYEELTSADGVPQQLRTIQTERRAKAIHINGNCTYALDDTEGLRAALARGEKLTIVMRAPSKLMPLTEEEGKKPPVAEPAPVANKPAAVVPETKESDAPPAPKTFVEAQLRRLVERMGYRFNRYGDVVAPEHVVMLYEPDAGQLLAFVVSASPVRGVA